MLHLFFLPHLLTAETATFGYTELLSKVDEGQVEKVTFDDEGAIKGNLREETAFTSQLPVALDDDQLSPKLKEKGVQVTGAPGGTSGVLSFVGSLLPLLLLVGFFIWMGKGLQRSSPEPGFQHVPVALRLRTGVAAFSYRDKLNFGITLDFASAPDAGFLAKAIENELSALARIARRSRPGTNRLVDGVGEQDDRDGGEGQHPAERARRGTTE
nr:ATP-dependent metallopeptidase FtsH/Yme1/Tma family protein [Amycolatopsis keratiniphila]